MSFFFHNQDPQSSLTLRCKVYKYLYTEIFDFLTIVFAGNVIFKIGA